MLVMSVAAYNRQVTFMEVLLANGIIRRNKSIFGQDADVYNPERWLREDSPKSNVPLGVYSNLYALSISNDSSLTHYSFTFTGGPRSCIGWRFA